MQLNVGLAAVDSLDVDAAVVVDRGIPGQLAANSNVAPEQRLIVVGERRQRWQIAGVGQSESVVELLPVLAETVLVAYCMFDQGRVERQGVRMDGGLVGNELVGVPSSGLTVLLVILANILMAPHSMAMEAALLRSAGLPLKLVVLIVFRFFIGTRLLAGLASSITARAFEQLV